MFEHVAHQFLHHAVDGDLQSPVHALLQAEERELHSKFPVEAHTIAEVLQRLFQAEARQGDGDHVV